MKHIFFLLLMALSMPSFCQIIGPPKEVPKSYWKELDRIDKQEVKEELKQHKKFEKNQGDKFDFFIPEVPLPVTASIQAEGNWSRAYLEIPENEEEIKSRLKGKFCMATLDTGEPDHSEVVKYKYPAHTSKSYTGEPVIDGHFHATHVAGSQVAKVGDSYIGIAHAAAESGNFKQAYYKVCTNQGGCSFAWMSAAIRDFIQFYKSELEPNGWDAGINMSIGGSSMSSDLSAAMKEAVEAGIVIFASAGNNGRDQISYPAKDVNANAVGAHNNQGLKASFSNWGAEQFVNAPGVLVYSTCLGDTECVASGTSMSSPQAAALYALLKIMQPDWTPKQTLDFMARHATDAGEPGFDDEYGYGIPKIGAYLEAMGEDPEDPCPDCPDCPDANPSFQNYSITLPGPYKIYWSAREGQQVSLVDLTEVELNAGQWLTVKDLVVDAGSQSDAEKAAQALEAATKQFFTNRGLILAEGSDIRQAMTWTDYFYRLIGQQRFGGSIRVKGFTGSNPKGGAFAY